jgi:hypothetical protein
MVPQCNKTGRSLIFIPIEKQNGKKRKGAAVIPHACANRGFLDRELL